jgi:hypothetical protein
MLLLHPNMLARTCLWHKLRKFLVPFEEKRDIPPTRTGKWGSIYPRNDTPPDTTPQNIGVAMIA